MLFKSILATALISAASATAVVNATVDLTSLLSGLKGELSPVAEQIFSLIDSTDPASGVSIVPELTTLLESLVGSLTKSASALPIKRDVISTERMTKHSRRQQQGYSYSYSTGQQAQAQTQTQPTQQTQGNSFSGTWTNTNHVNQISQQLGGVMGAINQYQTQSASAGYPVTQQQSAGVFGGLGSFVSGWIRLAENIVGGVGSAANFQGGQQGGHTSGIFGL